MLFAKKIVTIAVIVCLQVMEVDLSTKQQRLLRASASRASIRRQKAVEEEIMVSFKPVPSPPKAPVEVSFQKPI